MKSRVKVIIAGGEYTILADDGEDYIREVAAAVDKRITEIMSLNSVSLLSAAVLAAVNFADEKQKEIKAADNMRAQMKNYIDDNNRLRNELNRKKRELAQMSFSSARDVASRIVSEADRNFSSAGNNGASEGEPSDSTEDD